MEAADEVDRPLDMSTGRRASPPPYPSAGSSGLPAYPMRYPSPPDYASARPSVITCASSLRSSPAPSCPSPCGSTSSSASQSRTTTGSPPPSSNRRPAADGTGGLPQRREIISSGLSSIFSSSSSLLFFSKSSGGEEVEREKKIFFETKEGRRYMGVRKSSSRKVKLLITWE